MFGFYGFFHVELWSPVCYKNTDNPTKLPNVT